MQITSIEANEDNTQPQTLFTYAGDHAVPGVDVIQLHEDKADEYQPVGARVLFDQTSKGLPQFEMLTDYVNSLGLESNSVNFDNGMGNHTANVVSVTRHRIGGKQIPGLPASIDEISVDGKTHQVSFLSPNPLTETEMAALFTLLETIEILPELQTQTARTHLAQAALQKQTLESAGFIATSITPQDRKAVDLDGKWFGLNSGVRIQIAPSNMPNATVIRAYHPEAEQLNGNEAHTVETISRGLDRLSHVLNANLRNGCTRPYPSSKALPGGLDFAYGEFDLRGANVLIARDSHPRDVVAIMTQSMGVAPELLDQALQVLPEKSAAAIQGAAKSR